jgi:serine protease
MLQALQNDPNVAYIEPASAMVYPDDSFSSTTTTRTTHRRSLAIAPLERIPYGIRLALGSGGVANPQDFVPPLSTLSSSRPSQTPPPLDSSFCSIKVAILDSGLDVGHPDFDYCQVYVTNGKSDDYSKRRCTGRAFLPEYEQEQGQDWYNPMVEHGTHVAGTLAASGLNNFGMAGMIPDEHVCLVICRIFGDYGGAGIYTVADAIIWAVDEQHVDIINMSLGTETSYDTIKDAVDYADAQGVLLIASAGNGASSEPKVLTNFPGDYPNVLSVAAVDKDKNHAEFSNFNKHVNISGPGVEIFSSISRIGNEPTGTIASAATGIKLEGIHIEYSGFVGEPGVSGILMDCGMAKEECPAPRRRVQDNGSGGGVDLDDGTRNHICFIQRGEIPFYDKAQSCMNSGAIAAVIVNDRDGFFRGTLGANETSGRPNRVSIPIIGISDTDGTTLSSSIGQEVNLFFPIEGGSTHGRHNGTSMAAPHVAGAAALIWRRCRRCSKVEVQDCLLSTAEDLGEPGRDDYFGSGFVDASRALVCLQNQSCCQESLTNENSTMTVATISTTPPPSNSSLGRSPSPTSI